ncbi:MAG: chemotaxis protein CheA, partial [Pseudomonadales bacterium]
HGSVESGDILEALHKQSSASSSSISESAIRVDVGLLDTLMNLVGELVLTRNQILQFSTARDDSELAASSQQLNLITTELQEGVMKTRMQPIGNIWNKFPRVVRDLAVSCGKQVRIELEGSDTELDKTLIEAIKDPLTHLVRNAVDHGIETPESRLEAGKPREGRITLNAFHEGGQVNIEISDDGAGIAPEAIKKKALMLGIVAADRIEQLKDRDLLNLIFLPGFTTAERVTNVSGRGVGMDVVKTNIEKIGGTIDLQSRPGQGTVVKIKIPLTLAIIPALIVTSGGDRYAIPQASLLELVRVEGGGSQKGIERVHGAPVYQLRGQLLPLVYLNEELKVQDAGTQSSASQLDDDATNIVVLQAEDRQFGLVVDQINDTEEIVVKPLSVQLKGLPIFAGATILGDGTVALILDVLGIAECANVVTETRERVLASEQPEAQEQKNGRRTLLLVRSRDDGRMVIPLSLVARLEEFPRSAIENVGGRLVVQYRGQILLLISVDDALPERRQRTRSSGESAADTVQVVVHTDQDRSVGLLVGGILDIVDEDMTTKGASSRQGVLSTVVIQGRVSELLDVPYIIANTAFAVDAAPRSAATGG